MVATDLAPGPSSRSASAPLNVTILDRNDNQPRFLQRQQSVKVVDNIPYHPDPSPIAQVKSNVFLTNVWRK